MRGPALYRDRHEAGRALAERLGSYANRSNVLVLALSTEGVPVAFEVAEALDVPFDVFLVGRLGVPGFEEIAMGAIAPGDVRVLLPEVLLSLGISGDAVEAMAVKERHALARREREIHTVATMPDARGATVILVDDGAATGARLRAAAIALRERGAKGVVAALPVAAREAVRMLREELDDVVTCHTPEPFYGVGLWYDAYARPTDDHVRELLSRHAISDGR